ncbi:MULTISPECIES: hypothetical protein [unclassified Pseudomonas]|uniref:hypothetical protein n=1 Tax=unclassified Pseudomonas TaxID=196821 RepID=UPI002AC91D57|nr:MULTISPECIES: hypothetical protein [unclassified Pseudomonas]MEB0048441.1 hypothetical protein [Pseudomonas sp. Dout3]MEB0098025.1 hypothetical protein [Pseudomonas sp. DC1.2]WPX57051.1 hypothetical protein RHM68_15495 [Pseudomonas sp. DC1.2]
MHPVLAKTFGGLSAQYYIRNFLFGLIFPVLIYTALTHSSTGVFTLGTFFYCFLNSALYPYARFVYESIMDYIFGSNVFFVNAFSLLMTKLFTMAICWSMAIFIAPIGLAYLYYHHSRAAGNP